MKLFSLLFGIVLTLTGCTTADLMALDGSRYFKVFQVIDEGALAFRCDEGSGTTCLGMTVFIPNSVDPAMYDEKIIFMQNPTVVDRFTYITNQNSQKTIPVMVDKK